MKKVLLLGDSIRTGYAPFVRDLLDGKAEVFIPDANGAFLQNTLRFLQDWQADLGLTDGNVDIIHWNNGLWDCGHLGVGKTFELTCESAVVTNADSHNVYEEESLTPPDIYAYFLDRVYRRIKTLFPKAKVIFALTTNIMDEELPGVLMRKNSEIREYNRIAMDVLSKYGVEFNDLYSFTEKLGAGYRRDWVHFNDEGSYLIAQEVARHLV